MQITSNIIMEFICSNDETLQLPDCCFPGYVFKKDDIFSAFLPKDDTKAITEDNSEYLKFRVEKVTFELTGYPFADQRIVVYVKKIED